jgi:hypothetical protein
MRAAKDFPALTPTVYTCELEWCPHCEAPLGVAQYVSGRKTVQPLNGVARVAYQPKVCARGLCRGRSGLTVSDVGARGPEIRDLWI